MKTKILIAAICSFSILHSAFGQGALTPPSAPAPLMKSLDQIEPRTPISSAPFIITNSGSYYLTANLNVPSGHGITISNNNVTLDLNGFGLAGNSTSFGVYIPGAQTNITVRNGWASGWSAGVIQFGGFSSRNLVFEDLTVFGCSGDGITCGAASAAVVRDCLSVSNAEYGIYLGGSGLITDCQASYNKIDGIESFNCIVRNSRADNNGQNGIYVSPGMVIECLAENNGQSGIFVNGMGGSKVVGNTCIGNNTNAVSFAAGIFVNTSGARIEDNHVSASGYAGISVNGGEGGGNIIIRNSVSGSGGGNYLTPGNEIVGPLITTFGTITNSNPWANFSY